MEAAPSDPEPVKISSEAESVVKELSPCGASLTARPVSWRFLLARMAVLAGAMSLAGLVAGMWNERRHGAVGAELAIFSTLGCGCSAGLALLVVGITAGGKHSYAGLMSSILFRTLGPLALGTIWHQMHLDWPMENVIQIHVPLFLVSLTVETILVVDIVSSSTRLGSSLGKGRTSRNTHG